MSWRPLLLLAMIVAAVGCGRGNLDPAAEAECAEAVQLYSKLYVDKWGDHSDPAFQQVASVARAHAEHAVAPGECHKLLGLAEMIRTGGGTGTAAAAIPRTTWRSGPVKIVGGTIAILAFLVSFAMGLWLISIMLRENILWLVAYVLFPASGILFVVQHWDDTKKPFLIQLGGTAILALGLWLAIDPTTLPTG